MSLWLEYIEPRGCYLGTTLTRWFKYFSKIEENMRPHRQVVGHLPTWWLGNLQRKYKNMRAHHQNANRRDWIRVWFHFQQVRYGFPSAQHKTFQVRHQSITFANPSAANWKLNLKKKLFLQDNYNEIKCDRYLFICVPKGSVKGAFLRKMHGHLAAIHVYSWTFFLSRIYIFLIFFSRRK